MIRPFPFQQLPRLTKEHNRITRLVRRQLERGRAAWEAWIARYLPEGPTADTPAIVSIRQLSRTRLDDLLEGSAAVVGLRGPGAARGLLALDGKLSAALVALLLQTQATPRSASLTEAERGLVVYLVAALLHELGEGCDWSVDFGVPALQDSEVLGVEGRVTVGGVTGSGWLVLEPSILFDQAAGQVRPVRRNGRLAWIHCSAPVTLCSVTLPFGEIGELGEGDVIVSPELPRGEEAYSARLRVGDGEVPVTVHDGQLSITGPLQMRGEPMDRGEQGAGDTEQQRVVDSIPVELTIELGRIQLTAARLLELEVGDVVTLDRPTALSLDLRVADRLVARGELVDVEGEAGVRLVEVYD